MARITVEDCIKQVRNQYDLVILAKERTVQLGRGAAPAVDSENDKKPVIALREIGECKIKPDELEESIVNKLRRIPDYEEEEDLDEVDNDTFRQMYQGGLSKSEMEKSATRKFTARVPKIEPKPLVEAEEVNLEVESDTSPSSDNSIEADSSVSEIPEDPISAEENIKETLDSDISLNTDIVEENQSSEEISVDENPTKEE